MGIRILAAGLMLYLTCGAVFADDADFKLVEQKIRTLAPNASQIAIADSPIPGLLQVQIDTDIVYTSQDGGILLQGRMYDVATRQDLTDHALSKVRHEKMQEIDREGQIVFEPAQSDYELYVFTDIDCGYCRRLHNQMAEYNAEGIAIRYMAFPRAGVGSESYQKFVNVWCADDQRNALTLAKQGQDTVPAQCDNPVEKQFEMGRALGVSGTPALITPDGQLIPGYVQPKDLRQRLDAIAASE